MDFHENIVKRLTKLSIDTMERETMNLLNSDAVREPKEIVNVQQQ